MNNSGEWWVDSELMTAVKGNGEWWGLARFYFHLLWARKQPSEGSEWDVVGGYGLL